MGSKKLIIFGIGETAEIAFEYFTYDSIYEVVAFTVNKEFMKGESLKGLPVIDFAFLKNYYLPSEVELFVAISYTKLNRVRAKCYQQVKNAGFTCASYISSRAFVWHNVILGENCMIFENNVLQHNVQIGNGVILWSGNHIGHQTKIGDFTYVSSHVVISGFCKIGNFSFLGVNSTLNDKIEIGKDTIVGSGAVVTRSHPKKGCLLIGAPAKANPVSSYTTFGVQDEI